MTAPVRNAAQMRAEGSIFCFTEASYVEAIWFIAFTGGDWMAVVYRDGPGEVWRATHRVRHQVDDKVWGSADRKSVQHLVAPDGSDAERVRLRAAFEETAVEMAEVFHAKLWRVVVQGDAPRAFKLLRQQPWAHQRLAVAGPERPQ